MSTRYFYLAVPIESPDAQFVEIGGSRFCETADTVTMIDRDRWLVGHGDIAHALPKVLAHVDFTVIYELSPLELDECKHMRGATGSCSRCEGA